MNWLVADYDGFSYFQFLTEVVQLSLFFNIFNFDFLSFIGSIKILIDLLIDLDHIFIVKIDLFILLILNSRFRFFAVF